jgi:hypothetical protein
MPATHNALPDTINDGSGTEHRRLLRGTSSMLCTRVGNIVSLKENAGSQDVPRKPAVLFVCLGNICRSPLAEAAFRAEVVRIGLDVEVDSAGTGDWHAGNHLIGALRPWQSDTASTSACIAHDR